MYCKSLGRTTSVNETKANMDDLPLVKQDYNFLLQMEWTIF